ncbi:NADH-quinone oxidoreductase subunit NuoK [Helicobacter sp. 23-1048]
MIGLYHYLILASLLFCVGLFGLMQRRNLLMLFFCTEIMLNAANIALVAVGAHLGDIQGQVFAFFVIAIAAAEVCVGLGLLVVWFKKQRNIDLHSLSNLKG